MSYTKRKILPKAIEGFINPLFVCESNDSNKVYIVEQSEFDNELGRKLIACLVLPYVETLEELHYQFHVNGNTIFLMKNKLHSL